MKWLAVSQYNRVDWYRLDNIQTIWTWGESITIITPNPNDKTPDIPEAQKVGPEFVRWLADVSDANVWFVCSDLSINGCVSPEVVFQYQNRGK